MAAEKACSADADGFYRSLWCMDEATYAGTILAELGTAAYPATHSDEVMGISMVEPKYIRFTFVILTK